MNANILHEENITLYGKEYKQLTYEDGNQELRRFDEKAKMWITLRFMQDSYDDSKTLENLNITTKNALLHIY